jgi:hypothetical protein
VAQPARAGRRFRARPHLCLTPDRDRAETLAAYAGGEVVVVELRETGRYTPAWREMLPQLELMG